MDSGDVDLEGPLQVAAGSAGNRRFGALLKGLRERSGLSPQQVAEQAQVHVSFVRGIERGAQAPSVTRARALLACMKDQGQIQWVDAGTYDLLIRDPETGRNVAFRFKAKVKGQNRRADLDPAAAFLELMSDPDRSKAWLEATQPAFERLAAVAAAVKEQAAHPASDADFGRIARRLSTLTKFRHMYVEQLLDWWAWVDDGSADDAVLESVAEVERLLRSIQTLSDDEPPVAE